MSTKLARRLLEPTWSSVPVSVATAGPAVADLCGSVDFAPDPEQELILDAVFAVREDGVPAAFETTIIASRQQLKTATILMCELGWVYITEEDLVLHTAHRAFAVESAFRALRKIIKSHPALSKRLAPGRSNGITTGNGDEAIEFRHGPRIQYATRTGDSGRSLTATKIIGDEWYAATGDHVGALYPTLATVRNAQVVLASSAGKLTSEVLREKRDIGRKGLDPRGAYFEWGDPDAWKGCADGDACTHAVSAVGCALDDEDRWARIMPTLGRRVSYDTVRSFRKSMPPLEFARELTVWWEDPKSKITLVMPKWPDRDVRPFHPEGGRVEVDPPEAGLVLGVGVSIDLEWSSIGAGSRWEDGRIHLGAVDRRAGTRWLPGRLVELQDKHSCPVVVDEKNPDEGLIERLEDAGVEVTRYKLDDVTRSTAWIVTAVDEGEVTHFGHTELDEGVAAAVKRKIGDRFAWGRRLSDGDISMLEAVTLAGDGVEQGLTGSAFNIY